MAERELVVRGNVRKLQFSFGDTALKFIIAKILAFGLAIILGCLFASSSSIAASSSNGVYGGYVGSDAWANSMNEEASQRALMQHNLERGGNAGEGVPVVVQIVFPPNQTGLSYITFVTLVPQEKGAHNAMAIAVKNGKTIKGTFIPKKDVRGGHSYVVAVDSEMGSRYPIGRIYVKAGRKPQAFTISAPLLTPGSPHYSTSGPAEPLISQPATSAYAAPKTGPAYRAPTVGPGFEAPTVGPGFKAPTIGPGFVPPGSN